MKSSRRRAQTASSPERAPKLSRTHAPIDMSAVDWQRGLRRQFGREQAFGLENLTGEPFFSEFRVSNPASMSSYRVAIRGRGRAATSARARTMRRANSAPASTSSSTLGQLEKKRGAKAAFARGYRPAFSELYLRNEGRRRIHFRPGTECPPALREAAATLFDLAHDGVLPGDRFDALPSFMASAAKSGHDVRAYDDALDFIAGRRDAERRADTLAALFPLGPDDPALVKLLSVPLFPYQAEGALFAAQAGRALIGDDMGLGKTIQAIAATEILARHFGVSKVLVICPTSLKYQWQSEIQRFANRPSRVISGGRGERLQDYRRDDFCKITNYEKLRADLDLIADWGPDLLIVDEAQRVKNWNTVAARALKRIDSPYAIVLSGTPLENKLEELISIVQFVDQHRLGPTWKLLYEHQVTDDGGRVTGYRGLEKIGQTLAPIMIRRRKSEVLRQLPSRLDQNLLVPMTEVQMGLHQENSEVVSKIVQRWRRTRFLSDKDQRRMTCALQNMRMSCNSSYLLDQETDHGVKADELMAVFADLLADPDAKAVVFSQWTRTHDILIRRLEPLGLGHVSFHGSVPSEKRAALVERFRHDPACRVFLSTDAGSTGLNLQHASILVNMDLPWNPAILEQRIARIHRMGQTQPVRIINFVAKGTIEEGMLSVLAFKRSLSAGILDGGNSEIALGGSRLTRFMKEIETVTGRMGEGEAVTPGEEAGSVDDEDAPSQPPQSAETDGEIALSERPSNGDGARAEGKPADPWQALMQVGLQFVSALAASHDPQAPAHPWIERDRETGARSLKMPLPPPETARRLADALSALAEGLRSR